MNLTTEKKASTVKSTFSRETSVAMNIKASPSKIWEILVDANNYLSWNSTIISLSGEIEPNGKIKLRSTLDEKREFKLKIKEFIPEKKLVWGDGMGKRTFTLSKINEDSTLFTMSEKIGGPLFPMFSKMIPPFDDTFNQFALDLKRTAEE